MDDVIQGLRREHAEMGQLLDMLEREVAVFRRGEVPDYDLVQEILDYCLDYPDRCHHPIEDLILARIRERDPAAAEKVGDLDAEHAALSALTRKFFDATDRLVQETGMTRDWFADTAAEFIEAYRQHIAMEERDFFPVAGKVLSDDDWSEIDSRLANHKNPLIDAGDERRFATLRMGILGSDSGGATA
ncbi:MAG: hemerythrin domain-containing protein [Alphaproteobacteria bacterium]|jgi:hemerythrin-like domain-containing protein|nr:hemerythrin domain-containing protein [Alphaproteobacteria bacterium]MDP6603099.1 hemerythrin domain-containing protein [Rhodospirillales bacterium]